MSLDDKKFWQMLNMLEQLKERIDVIQDWQEEVNNVLASQNQMFHTYQEFFDGLKKEIIFLKNKKAAV